MENVTNYVIKNGNVYLAEHPSGFHWTEDISRARHFPSMTSANVYAVFTLEVSLTDYTVETVKSDSCDLECGNRWFKGSALCRHGRKINELVLSK